MHHYGAFTPKPHYAYANSGSIEKLDRGPLKNWKRTSEQEGRPTPKSCETYRDSKGRKCYKGTAYLKKTESLFCNHVVYRLCILLCILFMLIWIFELVICFRHRSPYLKIKLFPTKGVYYTLCLDSGGFVWWVGKLCQGPGTSAPFDSSCDGVIQGNARVLEANLRLWVGKPSWSLHISP